VFLTLVLGILALCILDFKLVTRSFEKLTEWIKRNPQAGMSLSVVIVAVFVVCTMPISYVIVTLAYTFAQVHDS